MQSMSSSSLLRFDHSVFFFCFIVSLESQNIWFDGDFNKQGDSITDDPKMKICAFIT